MGNYKFYEGSCDTGIAMSMDGRGPRIVETLVLFGACSILVYDFWLMAPVIVAGLQ
jgi:hypothetical protein